MIRRLFLIYILFACGPVLYAQVFTESNLPIVIISTDNGSAIPDEPKVVASMKIIYSGQGQRNFLDDQNNPAKLNYNGKVRIEIRGSSSQALPKKQYGLTTVLGDNTSNNNVSLLGMPRENDWILNGLAYDASLVRDYLTYNLSWKIGNYASRQRYCEVIINNSYQGLYILQEKIKIDDNRVNIQKITPTDNSGSAVTGGYLIKADKVSGNDVSAWTMATYASNPTDFIHESPDNDDITSAQHTYISSEFKNLAAKASNDNIVDGYPAIIDLPSFIDFIILNELSANVDAYQFSTYFHKERKGKIRAGPLWDSNLTYGNDLGFWGYDRSKTNTWQFDNGDNVGPRFWRDIFNNPKFRCYLSRRWNELTQPGQPLHLETISQFIDEIVPEISEASQREQTRWGTVGNHANEIKAIKDFLALRIPWMTNQLGSFSNCANVQTPPLVISGIHYHPASSPEFPDDDDLEFIELANHSDSPVDLSGIYLAGTGTGYQFPQYILEGRGVIQIANDREVFKRRHGFTPFGEFSRNLSNDTQQIILADAYGNIIDLVEYDDAAPWPLADGTGPYLKLIDLSLDNNDPSSWIASDEVLAASVVVGIEQELASGIEVFPNPTELEWNITSREFIHSVSVATPQGREMQRVMVNGHLVRVPATKFTPGIYLITIETNRGTVVKKAVRR